MNAVSNVISAVEPLDVDVLDFEHLELDDGRDFLLALVTGPQVGKVVALLERLRSWSLPATADTPALAYTNDEGVLGIVDLLQEWHRNRVATLQQIVDAGPDVDIQVAGLDGKSLSLNSDHRTGLVVGVDLALRMFGKFPLIVSEPADELDEEE
ncbi:hypothetical protein [Stutzerimonas kirkiae]|uniref:hypothetical protein n=1 Tax=Stutzerimonas kirkiae TaxID=2211392 RepID=UPI0010383D8F|nr:hypothetical protein [Stutzerimonas kirkiae]TBV12779.1 hypothetical protein DNK01_13930 [Stutzerimonas kirkiae]